MSGKEQVKFTELEKDQCYRLYSMKLITAKFGESLIINFINEDGDTFSSFAPSTLMKKIKEVEDKEGYEYFISRGKKEMKNGNKYFHVDYLKSEQFVETAFPTEADFPKTITQDKTVKLSDLALGVKYRLISKKDVQTKYGPSSIFTLENQKTMEVVKCFSNKSLKEDYDMHRYPIEKLKYLTTITYNGTEDVPNSTFRKHCITMVCTKPKKLD